MSWQPMFKQIENQIYLYGFKEGEKFICSNDEFLIEEPEYKSLPEDIIVRAYVPGVRHVLNSHDGQIPGDFPWPEGDRYLLKIIQYKNNIEKRRAETEENKNKIYESSKEGQIWKIDNELAEHDRKVPRGLEDLIAQLKIQLSFDDSKLPKEINQTIVHKIELREQRKTLK